MIKAILLLAFSICLLTFCKPFAFTPEGYENLQKAEEFGRKRDYDKAIDAYHKHIDYRLSREDRPEWENPYFYLLMIGDVQLAAMRPADALSSYQEAEKRGVDSGLVADRYRYLASWYEEHGQLQQAFEVLSLNRTKDQMLFDIMLDRISRKIVELEDLKLSPATPSPSPKQP